MATIRSCNKHNMIACVEKTAQNADFYQVIDFLTGCSINYSLLVDPDLIGPWLQQFWATATLQVINDVPHIRAKVAGKKILISEATIRADLLFDDENGVDCFPKQVIWDTLRDIGYEDEAGPSSPLRPIQVMDSEEQHNAAEVLVSISRPRGLSIPGPIQSQPQQPTQGTDTQGTDPKDKGKGILVEEPKKKKLTLQQIRALETTNDEEVARKIQAEWDAEEERKRFEELKKTKPKTTLRKPTSLAQERNQMMSFLKGQGYKNLQKLKYPQMKELYDKVQASIKDSFKDFIPMDSEKERETLKEREAKRLLRKRKATISEEQPSKKPKLRTETIDELRNYLRVVDFEKNAQDKESLEGISMITELQVIDSPDGEYLIIHRENNHFRAFDTLWEILHVLDRQDLYHLYRVVDDYYEHIPPTGLGLMLLGDLNIIWETAESSDDDFWKDQEEWEIIRWRFHESSGVHTLEIEDGTMIHMLAERRYPLSRELMIRMLEHGMEVEDESETAITLIHLFILWTTANGDNS
ncbi:hypothetical protein Tco_0150647 [Tanacetum coccineum]